MRVLVVGSGAREHAIVWKLLSSPQVSAVYAAPGNAGISFLARTAAVAAGDVRGLMGAAIQNGIDLTVVGPEAPLAGGIVDRFQEAGLRIFGPTQAAARLEWSKAWAKEFMQRHDIPVGRWASTDDAGEARGLVREFGLPVVLKADGLAEGKGAVVCRTTEHAEEAIDQLMVQGTHGGAGHRLVIEQFLTGYELSAFALSDGEHVEPLFSVRDYKPLLDGDRGPNTGGMGGYASPAYADAALLDEVRRTVLEPAVEGMAEEGAPYVGVLYAGLMVTPEGPQVLEFNCRWGDPEAQLLMPLLKSDLAELMNACIEGRLRDYSIEWNEGVTCGVVLASRGYPDQPAKGDKISGLDELDDGVLVFHAATRLLSSSEEPRGWLRRGPRRTDIGLVTDGGRVLTAVAIAPTLVEARAKAYANVERIRFEGMQYRRDVGAFDPTPEQLRAGVGVAPAPNPPAEEAPPPVVAPTDLAAEAGPRERGRTQRQRRVAATGPMVAVLMGSESDRPAMEETMRVLETLGISSEVHVMSAHRTPDRVREFARSAEARGVRVLIAGAGGAAHLPGVIASHTTLPVIGVPIPSGSLQGLDSLLSIVQMPGGVPVATVAVGPGGARNAAYLAAAIIGVADAEVRERYRQFRRDQSGGELG